MEPSRKDRFPGDRVLPELIPESIPESIPEPIPEPIPEHGPIPSARRATDR